MWNLPRFVLSIGAAALFAGCGESQSPIGAPGAIAQSYAINSTEAAHHKTFDYTGAKQSFKVPAGVTHVTITASGASGAPGDQLIDGPTGLGGLGGRVTATIPVTAGERLAILVGGSGLHGGFNGGGGQGCHSRDVCYGVGGGASDVRQGGDRLTDRVVVGAGGGGGGADGGCNDSSCGYPAGGNGGAGGGHKGGSGHAGQSPLQGGGGAGATQSTGGKGGAGGGGSNCDGHDGKLGVGGALGYGCGVSDSFGATGGGGGGGYYGGGGGGGGGYSSSSGGRYGSGGGGGGGSSFAESSATHVKMTKAAKKDDGSIVITW
jgi:hypothetical protein